MVLATNEWLNDSDDDQQSANNTQTDTTAGIETETPTDAGTEDPFESATNLLLSAAELTTHPFDNANIENCTEQQLTFRIHRQDEDTTSIASSIKNANTTVTPTPFDMAEEDNEHIKDKNETTTELDIDTNKSENNNFFNQTLLNATIDQIENANTNRTLISNSDDYAMLESNNKSASSVSNPITPQALSCALQSAMNTTNSNSNVDIFKSKIFNSLNINQLNSTFGNSLESKSSNLSNSGIIVPNNSTTNIDTKPIIENDGPAKIVLTCEPNSHPFQTRIILLTPNIECKVGRLIAKSKSSESNAIFDCKVLSRHHAVLLYSDDGKFYVKDTNSSNGTFINENKLGTELTELHFGDIVKFGVDVLENSRKEVHGCIIACVKLYLPDGREAISIDSNNQRSPHSGESKISFDEMHKLNLYMQEASQREKVLKSKLFNIQNILDATRKNSGLCWQSMIAEDQLLHRIHSLEKKLQIMEKNVPDSALRNEVLKLLEDKNSYQNSAKEALRKVYQERCDAMQMLAKIESAYTASDNECRILRDQVVNTNQSLQDVNSRLLALEAEYNEYKAEAESRIQEANEQTEKCVNMFKEKLLESELELKELRQQINDLMVKRANPLNDDEKQAIEKLDAAIADMDIGEDYDDEDEEDGVTPAVDPSKSCTKEEKLKHKELGENLHKEAKQVVNEATIMKWLQSSDLNQKEGSLDIFNAICNDSDSSDERENSPNEINKNDSGAGTSVCATNNIQAISDNSFEQKCANFINILQCMQRNLIDLEPKIVLQINNDQSVRSNFISETTEDSENDCSSLGKSSHYSKLKENINTLYEAYREICKSVKVQNNLNSIPSKDMSEVSEEATDEITNKDENEPVTDDTSSDDGGITARQSSSYQQSVIRSSIEDYKKQIKELNEKLELIQMSSKQKVETMENEQKDKINAMENECKELKKQVIQLTELTEHLHKEKAEAELNKGVVNDDNIAIKETIENDADDNDSKVDFENELFEKQTIEDLAVINNGVLQQEEELIMYKEQLEKIQLDNLRLREEMAQWKNESTNLYRKTLLRRVLPLGVVVVGIVIYFITSYF